MLLITSLLFAVYTHRTSYARSVTLGAELTVLKAQISDVETGTLQGDLDTLNAQTLNLSAAKLNNERPYSYALTLLFFSILLTAKGIYNALVGITKAERPDIKRLAQAGLLAALCYIGFTFFKIDIPVGTEKTAFHFGNVFCVLAALLLGGYWGGLAGAIGMTIGDLTTSYVTSAPKTFLLKLLIGLTVGLFAHKIFKLSRSHSPKYVTGVTVLASLCGMAFNVVADPLVGYFYKMYLLGVPQELASTLAKIATVTTAVNAVVAVIAASIFYLALRPALRKSGLFVQITPEKETI
ncbi:MAG: ECF transporter S component [Acetatifactor sp.]|nr:ECF transporter S component [Acetatifactor sp.]